MAKKIICSVLAMLIIYSSVMISAYAESDPASDFGFAVATDLHYVHPTANADEKVTDNATLSFPTRDELQNESGFMIDEFLNQCAENDDVNFVFITGDIVTFGRDFVEDHYAVAEKFRKFEQTTGKKIFVINGNHDNGSGESSKTNHTKFAEIYNEFGYDEAFAKDESCCSYAVNLNEKYTLIALDSCKEEWSVSSGITSSRLKWVKKQAEIAKKSGRHPILMMHHVLLEHSPLQLILSDKVIVKMPKTYATMFADWGIKLVFTGHTHIDDTATLTTVSGNTIYDFCTASLTTYPLQYKTFHISNDKISYKTQTISEIDVDALTSVVKGYTDEQINEMKTDFQGYVKKYYLETSVNKIPETYLTCEALGIKEGSPLYSFVNSIMNEIKEMTAMPLYGSNSIQALAKQYNINIPNSNYKTIWDVIGEIYCGITAGNKKYGFESTETEIVLKTINLAIRLAPAKASDKLLLSYANKIYNNLGFDGGIAENITEKATSVYGPVTPCEYLTLAILSPVIYGNLCEDNSNENIQGEIDGYGTNNNFANICSNNKKVLTDIQFYFNLIKGFIQKALAI